jgi:magnesium transporter
MPRTLKRKSKKVGLAPGSLIYTGEKSTEKIRISIINYNEATLVEKELNNIEECYSYINSSTNTWINIEGLNDIKMIERLGLKFNIHPLVLEDILNTDQRPKMNDYDDYLYVVLRMLTYDPVERLISSEQVSLILGHNYLISLQEKSGDLFEGVRERIRNGKGKIRKLGADYLAYALIDSVVDGYFTILEKIGELVEDIEDELITEPKPENLHTIHQLRREMILLRKSVWPLREVINMMEKEETSIIKKTINIYLRDVYEHTIQIIDTIESFRDMISGMLDTYLSSVSNKMNEVMKVLTIIATIFIPLTFIAGVWGMNFEHMPELKWPWIYPYGFWALMILIGGVMIMYFKRKHWL